MKSLLVQLAGLTLLLPALAGAQADLNTITKVEVKGATVEIVGSKKPNFTTFTMTDPPRLVIDISEAVFSGVPDEAQVGNGIVTAIKTASYGSDASAIARVLIGFTKDVETDIQSEGTKLVVKVAGGGTPEPVAAAEKSAPAAATPPADDSGAREAARRAEEERLAQQKAAREAEERARADAEATRKQQEQEAREAAKRAEDERRATKEAADRAEADRRAQEKADKEAAARAERERKEEEARAAAEEKQRRADEARAEREARAAEREPPRVRSAEPPRQDRVAMAERAPAPSSDSSGGSLSVSARRKTMTLVGFKQGASTSQVFVRTNEPVRYTVSRSGDKSVVVELENTRIALSNNERFLDTSYFDTAVAMVTPQEGPTKTVRIEIKLKESVPYEAHQSGNEVQIDFQRPARR